MERMQATQQELLSLIEKRRSQYGQVLVSSVLIKNGDLWRNSLTHFMALPKEAQYKLPKTLDYSDIIAIKTLISIDELKEVANQLFSGKVIIRGLPPIDFKGHYYSTFELYYKSGDEYINSKWPSNVYHIVSEDSTRGPINRRRIATTDAPFFPMGEDLLSYWMGLNVSRYGQFWNSIIIILPNYQARITDLTIESKILKIGVETNEIKESDIVGKLYCSLDNEKRVEDFSFKDNKASVEIEEIPDILAVSLISKVTGEVLDFRTSYDPFADPDIEIEPDSSSVEMLIGFGENEHVEFKESLSAQHGIIQSAVAFANTDGGVILVGVNDNGGVVGVPDPKPEETISNIIRGNTQPDIPTRIRTVTIDGKKVVVVQVMAGEDTPYWYRDNGTFVRVNATNRHASPSEIKQLVNKKQRASNPSPDF